jgi:hypothetical protein
MAIADKVYRNGYEQEFELELLDGDGEKTGWRVWVKDITCDAAVAVTEEYRAKSTDLMLRSSKVEGDGMTVDIPEGDRGKLWQSEVSDKYIACISRWDFQGEALVNDDDGEPDCTYENKVIFMRMPIFAPQIVAKVDEISGFTKPSK